MNIPRCIGITGYKGSGKDTFADCFCEKYGYKKISFAGPIKDKVAGWIAGTLNIPRDLPDDIGYLLSVVNKEYGQYLFKNSSLTHYGVANAKTYVYEKPYTPSLRQLIQKVGTEYYRSKDQTYWIKLLHLNPDNKYVVADLRFPDELALLQAYGAATFRVVRQGVGGDDSHASTSILKLKFRITSEVNSDAASPSSWKLGTVIRLKIHPLTSELQQIH